ncbi:MAG TPA: chloride channel protein, partial [Candidatus Hydrogenedentes bacterium]|nr:chloride channel protein [Candidatus Hydrogenedentota bacterium]
MGAGFTALGLRYAIDFMQYLFQECLGGALKSWAGIAWTIPVIALGGLVVGLITKYMAPETKRHGVPEVMLAVARLGGRIRPRVALVKMVASAITIGSGGSAGREGPIVHI